ncbi:hypothetical protein K469DRAFT_713481 [Zopfia rhizophila CBS 207.26]|uniref:Uncharacterized protein n=1 Tax=Zopfia rhizophila CBS 207.26 TaxID=1314779 RepID=A0A6A6DV64_9PEZI|nr:hypothetical protein K469DRAFT_713481 [Zopfia rhizophila CBS 207.26]
MNAQAGSTINSLPSTCCAAFKDCLCDVLTSIPTYLHEVDWVSEAKYIVAAAFTASLIVSLGIYIESRFPRVFTNLIDSSLIYIESRFPLPFKITSWMSNFVTRIMDPPTPSSAPRRHTCGPDIIYDPRRDFTRRICFDTPSIEIYGWPSKGGVIILEGAAAPDFDFLGIDRIHPPEKRHENPDEEDEFCKNLLLLGAKWLDSYARLALLKGAELDEGACIDALEEGQAPEPSLRERYWICVAWPSNGGLVVSEFDTTLWGFGRDADDFVPEDVARLRLCRNMDEKAAMLKERFRGKTFIDVEQYRGNAFINCWVWKEAGEHGTLQQTW